MAYQVRDLSVSDKFEAIGSISFTQRELDILACLLSGKPTKIIGPLLSIAPRTVETHVQRIMGKLNCNSKAHIIDFIEHSSHFGMLKQRYVNLLKEKNPNINIELLDFPKNTKTVGSLRGYPYFVIGMTVVCILILVGSAVWVGRNMIGIESILPSAIRSDLLIPAKSQLLERPQLLKKIEAKFKQQYNIQVVALVGIGGSGKTTIARQYAITKNFPLLWELNAESEASLITSFEDLAYILSKTEKEKQELEKIKNIDNIEEHKKKLLFFIKPKLKAIGRWFLLFDNVDNFNNIKIFLPNDVQIWGYGRVLITTRNSHIKDNIYINSDSIVSIQDLNSIEKSVLFTKIIPETQTKESDKKAIDQFLKYIPPFPLDILIAGHYIKNTQVSYKEYLEQIRDNDDLIEKTRYNFLQEISDYTKTRCSIITCTIQTLLKAHSEFIEPLLLISLIEPKNIPKALLLQLKNKEAIDQFIHDMGRHSLITLDLSSDQLTLSLHHSTQEIIWNYLNQALRSNDKKRYMDKVIESLEKFSDALIEQGDTTKMRTFVRTLLTISTHKSFLNPLHRALLDTHIGRLSYHLGSTPSKFFTERGLLGLKKHFGKQHHHSIARALIYLGVEEKLSGNYQKSQKRLEESVVLYQNFYPHRALERAYALLLLGSTYNYTGEFNKAKKTLEQSSEIYQEQNHLKGLMRANGYLGDTYLTLGDYKQALSVYDGNLNTNKKKFSKSHNQISWGTLRLGLAYKGLSKYVKAEQIIKEADKFYQILLPENLEDRSYVLMHLGDLNRLLGFYDKADYFMKQALMLTHKCCGKDSNATVLLEVFLGQLLLDRGQFDKARVLLERRLEFYKKNQSNTHPKVGWIAHNVAKVYTFLCDFEKAKEFFNISLAIYAAHYGFYHSEYNLVLCDFGHLLILKGAHKEAEILINQALVILQKNNHTDYYKCLEYLGDLYQIKKDLQQSRTYFKQALTLIQANFPKRSAHIARLKEKLKTPIV